MDDSIDDVIDPPPMLTKEEEAGFRRGIEFLVFIDVDHGFFDHVENQRALLQPYSDAALRQLKRVISAELTLRRAARHEAKQAAAAARSQRSRKA